MSAPPVHFFLHVPKCAGTTVEAHFERELGEGFLLAPRWNSPLRHVVGNRYPGLTPERLARVRVVSGHSLSRSLAALFPGREVRESVLLRDPAGYLVSFWNYRWTRHETRGEPPPPPFRDWRRSQRRDPITRFLLHRYFGIGYPAIYAMSTRARFLFLENAFRRFHFVGGHRRVEEALAGISAELGVNGFARAENVGAARRLSPEALSESERAEIEAENPGDALLHARWKDRGFGPGGPEGVEAAARRLPDRDGPRHLARDVESAVRRELWRR
jgi:hypothetical protein